MMYLMYEVHPKPAHPEYGIIDGAYASLWVNEPAQGVAEVVAQNFLAEYLWDVETLEEAYPVSWEQYEDGHVGRERFQQALIDGVVCTFFRWPVGAPDE
jgi:hypothetical protein